MNTSVKNVLKEMKSNESSISMVLGGLVVLVVGILLFNYFRSSRPTPVVSDQGEMTTAETPIEYQTENGNIVPKNLPTTYKVQQGDHLWGISIKHYGSGFNWVDIAEANGLGSGNQLEAGRELTIPKVAVRAATGAPQKAGETAMTTPTQPTTPVATVAPTSTPKPTATPAAAMPAEKKAEPGEKGAEVDMSKAITGNEYTVQKGDSLWEVSVRAYGDGYQWTKVFEANKAAIKNANYIETGMKLTLPR